MHSLLDIPEDLAPVHGALADALQRVGERFDNHLASDLLAVNDLVRHIERYRGKMLRPALVVLSGMACSQTPDDPEACITGDLLVLGAVCEMVHMATLVHDDVLDEAAVRRRGQTVNFLHGNETAVILGDLLIAAAYHLCSTLDDPYPSRAIGEVSMTLCAGELLQLANRDNLSLDMETYREILDRKTAALIGVSCRLGARSAGAPEARHDAMDTCGRRLGLAFQIQDDLLDLTGDEGVVGKSVRKDLEKGKLTYPIIDHLAKAEPDRRAATLRLLKRAADGDETAPTELVSVLRNDGAIERARLAAESLVNEARALLVPLAESGPKRYLSRMADAVVQRAF